MTLLPIGPHAQTLSRADGSTEARSWVRVDRDPEAAGSLGGAYALTHSVSEVPADANSVACRQPGTGYHTENGYYRRFNLPDFEVEGSLAIDSVRIAIESADAGTDGAQPFEILFYTLTGEFVVENLTDLGGASQLVEDTTLARLTIPVEEVVAPAESELVVEVLVPDGRTNDHRFYIGSNAEGETDSTFMRAPDCDIDQPTPLAEAGDGFPDMHLIMTVFGHTVTVATEPGAEETQRVVLGQSYPNPLVGDVAMIPLEVGRSTRVRIVVFDALGRQVAVPVDGTYLPGHHAVPLNVSNLPGGVYTYRVVANGEVRARRMVIVR